MEDRPGAVLVVEHGIGDLSVIDLIQPATVFGKVAEADIVVDNPYISRRHAEIKRDGDGYWLVDLASRNGTFVNGVRLVDGGHWLQTGDRIELAQGQVVLRFEAWGTTATLPAFLPNRPGDLEVDARSRETRIGGKRISPPLSRKEFDVLRFLYEHRGEACSKDDIALHGWPEREKGDVSDQEIEQCIRRLRLRVEVNPSRPVLVLTVRGFGYKLVHE
ncbi:MAG: hypothetical protein HW397_334 [Dehalococcoidia bacterium]|nr:hypothetical protein [Dehalococcoidia bacterium]